MVSIIIFLAAILLFIGLFTNTINTAIVYEQHQGTATKCSDLLDSMLLNPGSPSSWGQSDVAPSSFGVQDPEFTEYQLSAFSLMRLAASTGNLVEYDKTSNTMYTSVTNGAGAVLLTPNAQALNYTTALQLLGINGTYGFQLSLTPDVTVTVKQANSNPPLSFSVSATGAGFPFAGASISYCLIMVTLGQTQAQYPSYKILNGTALADQQGAASIVFPTVTQPNPIYAFIAYTHLDGIVGVGYTASTPTTDPTVVPIAQDMKTDSVALANSYDLNNSGSAGYPLKYNVTFVISTQDYQLSELSLGSGSSPGLVGTVTSGVSNPVPTISLPASATGILIVTYQQSSTLGGVVMMPWGMSSLAFPVNFGGNPSRQSWVATDLRQVMIGDVAYQAKLSLWSTKPIGVTGL